MQRSRFTRVLIVAMYLFCIACNNAAKEPDPVAAAPVAQVAAKPDLTKIRADIQALENEWADALNKKDIEKLMAFYGDDIVSMPNDAPTITGKEALRKQQVAEFAQNTKGITFSFETMDVFSEGNQVLEFGKTTRKDATGKVTSTGKYTAFYDKRDGKYVCIREMFNNDQKSK